MNDLFWRWLLRVNARGVFVVTLAALVLALAWRLTLVQEDERQPPAVGPAAQRARHVSPETPVDAAVTEKRDPFQSPYLTQVIEREAERQRRLEEEAKRRAEEEARERAEAEAAAALKAAKDAERKAAAAKAPAKAADAPAPAPAAAAAAAPVPEPKPVALLYRGMMRRTDGVVLALIENQTEGRAVFYKQGESVLGMAVDEIERDGVSLVRVNDERERLKAGVSRAFQEAP